MARFVWHSPIAPMVDHYRSHTGPRHLDVGPGTGYFLEKAELPVDTEVTLLDPNPNVLSYCARRLDGKVRLTTVEADVLKPLPIDGPFDSVGLSAVLHCLPGSQRDKSVAIRNIAEVMAPDGVLFGTTLLGSSLEHSRAARLALRLGHMQGGFNCLDDTAAGLREILEEHFQNVEVEVGGSLANFVAQGKR